VTFGGTELRTCSVSGNSSRSSSSCCSRHSTGKSAKTTETHGSSMSKAENFQGFSAHCSTSGSCSSSCSSRHADASSAAGKLVEAQTRNSSVSEVEDFQRFRQSQQKDSRSDVDQGTFFKATEMHGLSISEVEDFQGLPPQRNSRNSSSDVDPVRCKKAKMAGETSVWDESSFAAQLASRGCCQSFASLEWSLMEPRAVDDSHYWFKLSTPVYHEKSSAGYEVENIESPLSGISDSGSRCSRTPFYGTRDEPRLRPLSRQTNSDRSELFHGEWPPNDHYPEQQNSIQDVNSLSSGTSVSKERGGTGISALGLQSGIHPQELIGSNGMRSATVSDQRTETADKLAFSAVRRDYEWLAFINGITPVRSLPGRLILVSL